MIRIHNCALISILVLVSLHTLIASPPPLNRTIATISEHRDDYVIPRRYVLTAGLLGVRNITDPNQTSAASSLLVNRMLHGVSLGNFPLLGKCLLLSSSGANHQSVNIKFMYDTNCFSDQRNEPYTTKGQAKKSPPHITPEMKTYLSSLGGKGSYMTDGKLSKSCYNVYFNAMKSKLDQHVIDDALFYSAMLLRRGGKKRSKKAVYKVQIQIEKMQSQDNDIESYLTNAVYGDHKTGEQLGTLSGISATLNFIKGCLFKNQNEFARHSIKYVQKAWVNENFDLEYCTSYPCPQNVFRKLVSLLSSLRLPKLVVELYPQFLKYFSDETKSLIDFAIAFDRLKKHKTASKIYRNIFKIVSQRSQEKTLMWEVGPEVASYTRAYKANKGAPLVPLSRSQNQRLEKYSLALDGAIQTDASYIERRDARNFTIRQFQKEYASIGKPVIITNIEDADKSFRELKKVWTLDSLESRYGHVKVDISTSADIVAIQRLLSLQECPDHSANSIRMNVSTYIKQIRNKKWLKNNPPYLLRTLSGDMLESLSFPSYFQGDQWSFPENIRKTKALFSLGPANSFTGFHLHSAAFNYVAHGAKKWIIYPPRASPDIDFHHDGDTLSHFFKTKQRQPSKNNEKPLEAIQTEGEIMFIPSSWLHAVVNIGQDPTVAVAVELGWDTFYEKNFNKIPCRMPC